MSKLVLNQLVPLKYDKSDFIPIVAAICNQVNSLAEGRLAARHQAQASVPVSVSAAVGDIVWDSNCTVRGSVAPGVAASYVRLGWVCVAGSATAPTFVECRVLTGT